MPAVGVDKRVYTLPETPSLPDGTCLESVYPSSLVRKVDVRRRFVVDLCISPCAGVTRNDGPLQHGRRPTQKHGPHEDRSDR